MLPYQEEYIANLRQLAALAGLRKPEGQSFAGYSDRLMQEELLLGRLSKRNMELLRTGLFPVLDSLFEADEQQITELEEFSSQLYNPREELDVGLFCQIRQALLSRARQKRDREGIIRELYWLGMGRYALSNKLVGMELPVIYKYYVEMRLCFTEAAAYLKYYDEIEDKQTREYILRARANITLGQFYSHSERVALLRQTLQIFSDKGYQEKDPDFPWDRFIATTHQNIAASISYSRENLMTPQDMAVIMESVYIVYQRRIQEAQVQHKRLPERAAFNYYAINYYCGIDDLDHLLQNMEELLDGADASDFTPNGMYSMVSVAAFYCQFLQQYPERLLPRQEYLENLYTRTLAYINAYPETADTGVLFQYLRQLVYTFVETKGSISYGSFLLKLMIRFVPGIYIHALVVGSAAASLCEIILEEEPGFFDDIDFIRVIQDPEEKRREVLRFAMGCGVFHDVGKINIMELYARTSRQWFAREYEMARLHTISGSALLEGRKSTKRFAPAALGHHAWYDGSAHGYPESYKRLECPSRQMVDVIALISWIEDVTHAAYVYTGVEKSFEQAVQTAIQLEGKRFSPMLTAFLRDSTVAERLNAAFTKSRRHAHRRLYEDICGVVLPEE